MAATPTIALGDRSVFPQLEARAYLNHAAISPPTVFATRRVDELLSSFARFGRDAYQVWFEQREALRGELATFIGAQPDDVALLGGTTQALSALALSLPWQDGDRVVLFDGEFPANVTPWLQVAKLFRLEPRFISLAEAHHSDDSFLGPLERELVRGARLVAVSAVQFQSGLRMPLATMGELCQRYGAELAVDAIQAVGVVPLDVMSSKVDYLAGGAHKWLCGLEGAGYLYARSGLASRLRPRTAGWQSHQRAFNFLTEGPGELAYDRPMRGSLSFLEGSSTHNAAFAAMQGGLMPLQSLGTQTIFDHVARYLDALEPKIQGLGFESRRSPHANRRSGILSFVPPRGIAAGTLAKTISERGVSVSSPDGLLRFAPHFANSLSEVSDVAAATAEALVGYPG